MCVRRRDRLEDILQHVASGAPQDASYDVDMTCAFEERAQRLRSLGQLVLSQDRCERCHLRGRQRKPLNLQGGSRGHSSQYRRSSRGSQPCVDGQEVRGCACQTSPFTNFPSTPERARLRSLAGPSQLTRGTSPELTARSFSKIPSITFSLPANSASGPPPCTFVNGGSWSAAASMMPWLVS